LPAKLRVLLEVTSVYLVVIGICRTLFSLRSVPLIAHTLPLWAAGLFLYIPLLLLFMHRQRPEPWGISWRNPRMSLKLVLLLSLLFLPAFLFFFHCYQSLWLHVKPAPLRIPAGWALMLVYHLLCVAFPEEVFYRGYMQSRLNEAFTGRITVLGAPLGLGWIYTAVLFAIGHFLIDFRPDTLGTLFPGLVFGWLRERTGSIVAPTLFHALCNGTVLLLP